MALPNVIESVESKSQEIESVIDIDKIAEDSAESVLLRPIEGLSDSVTSGFAGLSGSVDELYEATIDDGAITGEITATNKLLSFIDESLKTLVMMTGKAFDQEEFAAEAARGPSESEIIIPEIEGPSGPIFGLDFLGPAISGAIMGALSKISIGALVGTALGVGIIDGIDAWDVGKQTAEAVGAEDMTGKLTALFAGSGTGLASIFGNAGRYAVAGAAAGALIGPLGVIGGGILGAVTGGIIGAITQFVGLDTIIAGVQSTVDLANEGLEFFTGTNVDRAESRLKAVEQAQDNSFRELIRLGKEEEDTVRELSEAKADGATGDVLILEQRLVGIRDSIEDQELVSADLKAQNADWNDKIANANKGLLSEITDLSKEGFEYMKTLPRKFMDTVGVMTTAAVDWLTAPLDFSSVGSSIVSSIRAYPKLLIETLATMFDHAAEFFSDPIRRKEMLDDLVKLPGKIVDLVVDTILSIVETIGDALSDLIKALNPMDLINEQLSGTALGNFLDIEDPGNQPALTPFDMTPSQIIEKAKSFGNIPVVSDTDNISEPIASMSLGFPTKPKQIFESINEEMNFTSELNTSAIEEYLNSISTESSKTSNSMNTQIMQSSTNNVHIMLPLGPADNPRGD